MKKLEIEFEKRHKNISRESILNFQYYDINSSAFIKGLENEFFGIEIHKEDENKIRLFYFIRKDNQIYGESLELEAEFKLRNELTLYFAVFLKEKFQFQEVIHYFNTFQILQRNIFEEIGYWTYGKELIKAINNKKIHLFTKSEKGVLFVPLEEEKIEKKERKKTHTDSPIFIYLMRNNISNYIKIGKSTQPVFRERTLQSQEPNIELLFKHEAPSELEILIHRKYKNKRIRGEWIDLTLEDIEEIKSSIIEFTCKEKPND